jgi:hypothetical protein
MKQLIIFLVILLLTSVSSAKYEALTLGPYKVSFDLNTTQEYNINVAKPIQSGTYGGTKYTAYMFDLEDCDLNIPVARITVFSYNDSSMDKSIEKMDSSTKQSLYSLGYHNIKTNNRIIDGQQGILGPGDRHDAPSLFFAVYWPDTPSIGDTWVSIRSIYPWEPETSSLLKTIHVELTGQ